LEAQGLEAQGSEAQGSEVVWLFICRVFLSHDLRVHRMSVFTLFPELITTHAKTSVLGRAASLGIVEVVAHDLRSHGVGVHQSVDDAPFGGGAGMVLACGPIFEAVEGRLATGEAHRPVIAMGPRGRPFTQQIAGELAEKVQSIGGFSLLCGRYEGFDERIHEHLVDDELSIGDFVLGGGEVAAMAIVEAVGRLLPGVMGNETSATEESFSDGLLEYPQYTRPAVFRGWGVPDVLRSGDHAKVARWRKAMSLAVTHERRRDLMVDRAVDASDGALLKEFGLVIPSIAWPPDKPKRKKRSQPGDLPTEFETASETSVSDSVKTD
jgi:tRNA (guanine37-N1)-methyltransferase